MSTTSQTHGGGAQPASIDTSGKMTGGPALRVYGFDSEADAQAAGFVCEGGPAMSVSLITDAQIASGEWKLEGDPFALPVYTAPASMPIEGGFAVPVYPINGWGSTPAPVAPLFVSAEVGTVNASTVAVAFDQDVSASDYSAGVTIKVDGTATSITSATRQSNHAIVYYVIPVLWHGSGDTVTWEYAEASGNIVAEDDSTPLGDVTAQSVTNNCEYEGLLDLQADTLALNDGDPVGTWPDQSGNNRNFTQTGGARPTKQTVSTYAAVRFDSDLGQYMVGSNFADNLPRMTLIMVVTRYKSGGTDSNGAPILSKLSEGTYNSGTGWWFECATVFFQEDSSNYVYIYLDAVTDKHLTSCLKILNSSGQIYKDGVLSTPADVSTGTVTTIANSNNVLLGSDDGATNLFDGVIYGFILYSGAPVSANRAALEARLAARYGITL